MANEVVTQLAPVAQQYAQTQSPEAAMQLIQMVAQSQDPQLIMMIADQITSVVMQSAQDPAMQGGAPPQAGGMPQGDPNAMAMAGGVPAGQNGLQMPQTQQRMYQNGGVLTLGEKLLNKRKQNNG